MAKCGNVKEQKKIATGPEPKNNFREILGETVITTAFAVDDENFDDNELKKLFVRNFKLYEKIASERNRNTVKKSKRRKVLKRRKVNKPHKRKRRELEEAYVAPKYLECISCQAYNKNNEDEEDKNCYAGKSKKVIKCSDAAQCYTELNHQFIKRGCILPDRLNRIFVCNCPLCNDKPSNDHVYYTYRDLKEWEFDNYRLEKPLNVDLLCRVCETRGLNVTTDNMCRVGSEVEYAVCGRNQYCYTNINDEAHYVARGCIDVPVYNSIYFFCNNTECNKEQFETPRVRRRFGQSMIERFLTSKMKPSIRKSEALLETDRNRSSLSNYEKHEIVILSFLLTLLFTKYTFTLV